MNLYQLYYFKTLARIQHYTKAAEVLCLAQPSLSNAISSLEREIGAELFVKKGRNVVLTKEGEEFLRYVENALDELEKGIKKIKDNTQIISIGFIDTLTSYFIPYLIKNFKKDENNKDVQFLLKEGSTKKECTADLVNELKSGNLDLIFISLIPKDDRIEFIQICEQPLVLIMSENNPLAIYNEIDLRDTASYPLIQFSSKEGLKKEINRLFAKVNMVPKVCCEVADYTSMAGLVAADVGIAIVPDNPVLHNFKVQFRPICNPDYRRPIYIGYMKNKNRIPPINRFIDYVINSEFSERKFSERNFMFKAS